MQRRPIRFITGTPGAGKTYSVSVAAGYLHILFSSAQGIQLSTQQPQQQAVAYVNADDLVEDPGSTLWGALILAFIHDPVTLNLLEFLDDMNVSDIVKFVRHRKGLHGPKSLYLIVDDGNKLDMEVTTDDEEHKKAKRIVQNLLFTLSELCTVVLCSPIRSNLRKKDTRPVHLLVSGGYSETELKVYLKYAQQLESDELNSLDLEQINALTGSVPRLVYDYVFEGAHELESSLKWYKQGILGFLKQCNTIELDEFMQAVRGEPMMPVTAALDSRAFYTGPDGRARCLTSELLSFTVSSTAERTQAADYATNLATVANWAGVITNGPRIGWNAEAAAILALRLLHPQIRVAEGVVIKIHPEVVRTFPGTFSRDVLGSSTLRTLHIPQKFNHVGADVYYSDDEWLVVVQISIATNAKENHPNTLKVANDIFSGDTRKKAVVWVIYSVQGWQIQTSTLDGGAYEVVMNFTQLCHALHQIDATLWELKGQPRRPSCTCPECYEDVFTEDCVDCILCGNAMHRQCNGVAVARNSKTCKCKPCRLIVFNRKTEGNNPFFTILDESMNPDV